MEQFIKSILSYEYVSFDIFDTLLFRTVSKPVLLFEMVAEKATEMNIYCPASFPYLRRNAEGKARTEWLKKGRQDICIYDIYHYLPCKKENAKQLMDIEIWCEEHCCLPNKQMIDIVNWCRMHQKKVVITTDMYLPRQTIDNILKRLGVVYDYLFISGEVGLTKRTGDLYPYVLSQLGIKPFQIIHTGDDSNNDIIMPRKYGIASIERIINNRTPSHYYISPNIEKKPITDHLRTLFDINVSEDKNWRIGYTVMGPLMVDFCQWLHKQKKEKDLDRLLFVAREGWLIKHCYDAMFPNETNFTVYVRLNRNVLSQKSSLLIDYLYQCDVVGNRIGLVNNSINGTGQTMLENFMLENRLDGTIVGLQFVKSELCIQRLGNSCYSFISDSGCPWYYYFDYIWSCYLMEHLMFESNGTSLYLRRADSYIVEAVCDNPCCESYNFPIIERIHYHTLNFVKDYVNNLNLPLNNLGIDIFRYFFRYPMKYDAQYVGSLYDKDAGENVQMTTSSISYNWKVPIFKNTGCRWPEAFFVIHNIPMFLLKLYHVRLFIRMWRLRLSVSPFKWFF